jgi:hypothetical protein
MYRILMILVIGTAPTLSGQQHECSQIPDSTPIQPIGAFSNMRFTEEHAYGYIVDLWRGGKCLFGLFEASEGLSGDTPTGRLESVRHDVASGKLVFAAKLTMGVTKPVDGTDWVPTRDSFDFVGLLSSRAIKGKLSHSDQLRLDSRAQAENVVLPLSREQQEYMIPAGTYGDWRKQAVAILRARGPKW